MSGKRHRLRGGWWRLPPSARSPWRLGVAAAVLAALLLLSFYQVVSGAVRNAQRQQMMAEVPPNVVDCAARHACDPELRQNLLTAAYLPPVDEAVVR